MLDAVWLPPDSRPFTGVPPANLHAADTFPFTPNLVLAHRLWTVNEVPRTVWKWLRDRQPRGLIATSSFGSGTVKGVPSWNLDDDVTVATTNISRANLLFDIVADTAGSAVIRVDAVVHWTTLRPSIEFVPSIDRTVTVTVIHIGLGTPTSGAIGEHVITSNPTLVRRIEATFNGLHVEPPPAPNPGGCPGPGTVEYRAAFTTTTTARPDLIVTVGRCGDVNVTVNGRTAPQLDDLPYQRFAGDVARVLGLAYPHFD